MSVFDKLSEITAKGLKKGADEVEVFFQKSSGLKIKAHRAKIESLLLSNSCGCGIRVFKDKRMGYAFTSGTEKDDIDKTLIAAIEMSVQTKPDEANGLPERNTSYEQLDLYREEIENYPLEKKIDITFSLEQKALDADPRIKTSEHVSYGEAVKEIFLVNSKGFSDKYKSSACGLFLSVIAEDNSAPQTGYSFGESRAIKDLDVSKISEEAVCRATALLGAKTVSPIKAPVVFDPIVTVQILSMLASSVSGDSVQKQRSIFTGKLNQDVAVSEFNLTDDGTMKDGLASSPFDDEGVPRRRNVIIEKGKLVKFLHNTYSARKDALESTGNASRGSYGDTPGVAPTNFYLGAGEFSKEEIISSVDNGFYVMDLQGMHSGTNPVTGEISVGAKGLWIRKGALSEPVAEVTIAGNLKELLFDIEMTGNDLRFFPMGGNYGAPSVKISKMVVSGH
ncbi:MAG: TldD/PmbA family protein [Actinobacteria bacterium]|nr:TldD/PmbA family protein [Actinomycetota bacterium]